MADDFKPPFSILQRDGSTGTASWLENFPAIVSWKDRDGKFVFASRLFAEMVDKDISEILDRSDEDLYPPELARAFSEIDALVMKDGEPIVVNRRMTNQGQSRFYELRTAPVYGEDQSIHGVQTVFWDITDQLHAEKSLLDERDMLQTIMDNLPDFIYVKDGEGRYVVINDAVRRVLRANNVQEVIGKTNREFLPTDQAELESADDESVIKTGQPLIEREEKMQREDGNELWILTSKIPLHDKKGNVKGLVGIDRDITHLKSTEAELRSAKEDADDANRAKGDFLANMSHEIRTPLNAIIGMTDLLLETQLNQTQRDYLSMVQHSGESLLTLINDILDFSKIEAGKLELDDLPFDIRECLGDTMKSMGLRAYEKGIELAVHVDSQLPKFFVGDPVRLRQVVVNLVGNAIKFTERGEVVLDIQCDEIVDDVATVHFSVTDTGIGISAEQCEKIFDEFEQADASTTRRFGGTGLGLAISSRLVGLMNGKIWVESQEGVGSKFQFTIRIPVDTSQVAAERADHHVDMNGRRVLVVDDNATNRRILKDMLSNWGMAPTTVSGADQAIQSLHDAIEEQDPYQLVVSDVNMPDKDGITMVRSIRDADLLNGSCIIMLTSGARPEDATHLRSMGVLNHLMKPVKQSELFTAMASALSDLPSTTIDHAAANEPVDAEHRMLRILLAEDNAVNQKLALGILGNFGHEVTLANNGKQAVEANDQHDFDLILMDVQMPEMDGLTATREIRQRESDSGKRIPIVAMTAHAMKGDREECLSAGMDDYLTKPIRMHEISNKLRSMFPPNQPAVPAMEEENLEETHVPEVRSVSVFSFEEALESTGGNQVLFRELVEMFLLDTPNLVSRADDAYSRRDAEGFQEVAHSVKGSLLFLRARRPFDLAESMEQAAVKGNLFLAKQVFELLKTELDSIYDDLKSYLEENA